MDLLLSTDARKPVQVPRASKMPYWTGESSNSYRSKKELNTLELMMEVAKEKASSLLSHLC